MDFFGIKKNFRISNRLDEIPEVEKENESTSFWLNKTGGLEVVVVKKNGSLMEFKMFKDNGSLTLFRSPEKVLLLLLVSTLFCFCFSNEAAGINLGYLLPGK